MAQCPSMDRNNPMYQDYDDNVCAWCGQELPENPAPISWAFHGVCDCVCALYQGLSDLGVAPGMTPPKHVTPEYAALILEAASQATHSMKPQRPLDGTISTSCGDVAWTMHGVVDPTYE
jgi:hypothetical protein